MALTKHPEHIGRSFGVGKVMHNVQRGVGAIMAAKGIYDSAKSIYTTGKTIAPIVSSLAAL